MSLRTSMPWLLLASLLALTGAAGDLIKDGGFEGAKKSTSLRRNDKGQDWYESRKDKKAGPKLLLLSTKTVAGNATHKAMIKGHPDLNTYLTQKLAVAQTGRCLLSYDVCVKEILPDDNRSAFCFLGASYDKKGGPNSTAKERFLFLGWENSPTTPGKLNLFAREADKDWTARTVLARDEAPMTWHHVEAAVDVKAGTYKVRVDGGAWSKDLKAVRSPDGTWPKRLSYVSFASWNDGAGTFYVDNVSVTPQP
jgi:hypothetical protein